MFWVALLIVAAAAVAAIVARRSRAGRARPIFRQRGIGPVPIAEGLLHAMISDRGYFRDDTRILGVSGSAIVIERDGAAGRFVLAPLAAGDPQGALVTVRALADRHAQDRRNVIALIGGDPSFARDALQAAAPMRAFHVDDDGALREARGRFR